MNRAVYSYDSLIVSNYGAGLQSYIDRYAGCLGPGYLKWLHKLLADPSSIKLPALLAGELTPSGFTVLRLGPTTFLIAQNVNSTGPGVDGWNYSLPDARLMDAYMRHLVGDASGLRELRGKYK